MKIERIGKTQDRRWVKWYLPLDLSSMLAGNRVEIRDAEIHDIAFPPRRGVTKVAAVLDDASMPPEIMTEMCRGLGISAALSWLASNSMKLHS